jgi:hypothetical protein
MLAAAMVDHFSANVDPRDLAARVADARLLAQAPLAYHPASGTQVLFVANRLDETTSLLRIQATAAKLSASGAKVDIAAFEDEKGHSAFFRSTPVLAEQLKRVVLP